MNNFDFETLTQIGKQMFKKYPYTEYSNELRIDDEVAALVGYISETRNLTNSVAEYLKKFIELFGDRLSITVKGFLEDWLEDGTLENVINEALFNGKSTIITSVEEPEEINDTTYWYKIEKTDETNPPLDSNLEYDIIGG